MAREQHLVKYTDNDYEFEHTEDEIIKSLQQPKYPIAFECEMFYRVKSGTIQEHKEGKAGYEYYERKTITNSDGRKEWVGKYIW